MLVTHAQNEIEEINQYISQDYTRIIEIYDNLIQHSDQMADYFSKGIIDLLTTTPESSLAEWREVFKNQDRNNCITYDQLNNILHLAMFWVELFEWFRSYVISRTANRGNEGALYEKIMQVIVEFGDHLKTLIDEKEADEFTLLIQEYISLLAQLLEARLSNNTAEADRIYQLIINNLNQRAEHLSTVFPNLSETAWRNQLYKMNTNLINMGTALLTGDLVTNIQIFDALINQAEELGFYFIESLFDLFN